MKIRNSKSETNSKVKLGKAMAISSVLEFPTIEFVWICPPWRAVSQNGRISISILMIFTPCPAARPALPGSSLAPARLV